MKALLIGISLLCSFAMYSQNSLTVHFDFNKYSLTHEEKIRLDSFLLAEKDNLPGSSIHLDGYCDHIGSDGYNKTLSTKRVSAVKKHLLSYGIERGTIGNTFGHGEKDPLNENKTEEERQVNRRVEISIIKVVVTYAPGVVSLMEKLADSTTTTGTNIILRNINFVGGRHQFLPESQPMLEELLEAMRTYQKLVIEIQGHICCVATTDDGMDNETGLYNLSQARAKAVMDYLVSNGISATRISSKGIGHFNPIYPYPERSETEMILNRRVEIKIISK